MGEGRQKRGRSRCGGAPTCNVTPLTERQTCARTRVEKSLKLANHRLKRVTEVKFLGVIIDENISWELQINHLKKKQISSIIVIKRIKQFIPKNEYLKIYNSLFKSHISYCISCWGGISQNRFKSLFSIQKRCVRLLFGKELNFDFLTMPNTIKPMLGPELIPNIRLKKISN